MIVTADPLGDFNATSQILRYSALAREVTVPRIPSITATILANPPSTTPRPISPAYQHHPRPFMPPGNSSSGSYRQFSSDERATMELAALEIARLSDDMDQLRAELDYQMEARVTAEAHLLSMEDRMLDLEAAIREDCAIEFEQRLGAELARFKASMAAEQERNDEHWDRKVDVLEKGLGAADETSGAEDKENVLIENLEEEVERLRRDNAVLRRELTNRSPSKRRPLEEREEYSLATSPSSSLQNQQLSASPTKDPIGNIGKKLEKMRVSNSNANGNNTKTAGAKTRSASTTRRSATAAATAPMAVANSSPKKVRRLGNKRWEDEDLD
jgi:hypothetical protein